MKKIIALALLMLSILCSVPGQPFFPIDTTSVWMQEEEWIVTYLYYERYRYGINIDGDTNINGTNYMKLLKTGSYYSNSYPGGATHTGPYSQYFGAVYSDSNRIYRVRPHWTHVTLLYDFDLAVGDTIKSYVGAGLIIQYIDTLNTGRRKFLTNDVDFFIIEGVGSNLGLLGYHIEADPFYNVTRSKLGCYSQYGQIQYVNDSSLCNIVIAGVDEEPSKKELNVYPNPTTDWLYLDGDGVTIETIEVYDAYGKRHTIDYSGHNKIKLSHMPYGIYLIIINDEHIFKIIKI